MSTLKPIVHAGIHVHRLPGNPLEKVFAECWSKLADGYLETLLYGPNKDSEEDYNLQRDAIVSATLIQWLGSPVGQGFLEEVREKLVKKDKKK